MTIKIVLVSFFIFLVNSCLLSQEDSIKKINIFGFTQIRISNDFNNVDSGVGNLNFQINKARVGIEGNLAKNLTFLILSEGGSVAPQGPYKFSILDCNVSYIIDDLLTVRIGQDWYKFGWEYTQPIPTSKFIYFADFTGNILDNMGRNGNYGYDIGIWAFGKNEKSKIKYGYNFGLTNGTGLNKNDDNNLKDIYLRTYIEPLNNLHFGTSFFKGVSTLNQENLSEYIIGLEFLYSFNKINFVSEYIYADYSGSITEPVKVPRIIKDGYYFSICYKIFEKFELLSRYENNRGIKEPGIVANAYTLGVNYNIKGLNNIKLNYLHKTSQLESAKDLMTMQFQIFF